MQCTIAGQFFDQGVACLDCLYYFNLLVHKGTIGLIHLCYKIGSDRNSSIAMEVRKSPLIAMLALVHEKSIMRWM